MRALLVEDHPTLASHTRQTLRAGGFEVDAVETIASAQDALSITRYDVILLDRQLPDGDGLDWLRAVRLRKITTPIIIMTATRRDVGDRIEGLNDGADDYVVKPIEFEELIARVRAVLRRPDTLVSTTLSYGNVVFNTAAREAYVREELFTLSRREMCLLESLMRRAGHVVARISLEESLYGYGGEVTPNAIEVSVHRLRSTLKKHRANIKIHTVRGIGYMLVIDRPSGTADRKAAPRGVAPNPPA